MKAHTSDFKNEIKVFGRQLDSIITYTIGGETIELGNDDLNSVTPHYEGAILKSVMKQLDIDSNVAIPIGTVVNYQFGVLVNDEFEYLDYGNYIVYSVEVQEDTKSYKIVCYDKMLLTMKPYVSMGINYPITVRDYINAVCQFNFLTFANASDTFANYDKEIQNELYLTTEGDSLEYTFRDVLDELAQVTASTICINDNDEVEIRYINDTEDTIDEEYLKDVNVNFGEKYGPINSIVLSRAGGSDNVYLQDEESVEENGLCELKISDNQVMNFNDRSDYLPDILEQLDGLEYHLNDFTSTGVCYYDVCDRYNVAVGENEYSCVMFNNENNITQGLEEKIYTDLPEESETDYTKADKTDRRINQTYIIVDKQNQVIQSLAERIVDVSTTKSGVGSLTLENAHKGELHKLSIKGQISLLFPQSESNLYGYPLVPNDTLTPSNTLTPSSPVPYGNEVLYPSSNLFSKSRILLIDDVEYELDFDFLNYINNDVCDEFVYEDGKCYIIWRVGIDSQGNKYPLDNEVIEYRKDVTLFVDTSSVIRLKSFDNAYYESEYLLENKYTDTFATNVRLNSTIEQTAEQISMRVSKNDLISEINQSADTIELRANRLIIDSDYFKLSEDGEISSIGGTIGGFTINENSLFGIHKKIETKYTTDDLTKIRNYLTGQGTLTPEEYSFYDYDKNGIVNTIDYIMISKEINMSNKNFTIEINSKNLEKMFNIVDESEGIISRIGVSGAYFKNLQITDDFRFGDSNFGLLTGNNTFVYEFNGSEILGQIQLDKIIGDTSTTMIVLNALNGNITCVSLTQTSKEESKKNFEKYTGALEEVLKTDIYKYNLDFEKDTDKKHLGFVIGNNYNYSSEITSTDENGEEIGVDNYSMTSLCLQAIKEQQEIIENLKQRIEILERRDN